SIPPPTGPALKGRSACSWAATDAWSQGRAAHGRKAIPAPLTLRAANWVTHAVPTSLNCRITSARSPPWGTGRAKRAQARTTITKLGEHHVQGAISAGSFPERAAARARAGLDLPGQRHQAAGHGRILRPVRGAAAQYRQPDGQIGRAHV